MADWTRYRMTLPQLRQYLQIRTGQENITVLPGQNVASSHLPAKIVMLDPTDPMAATSATHEGLHITETQQVLVVDGQAVHLSPEEQIVLNVLEDGRIERLGIRKDPGLRVQFQEDIDALWGVVTTEEWTVQALKGMYMLVGGYQLDEVSIRPQARKVLARFRPFVTPARKARTTSELVPLLKPIIALFDAPLRQRAPKPEPDAAGRGGEEEGATGTRHQAHLGDAPDESGPSGPDEFGGGGEDDEVGKGDGTRKPSPYPERGDEDSPGRLPDEGGTIERDPIEYDADEMQARRETAEKMGMQPGEGAGRRVRVRGSDTVKGGPTVNQLAKRARTIGTKIRNVERRQAEVQRQRAEEGADNYVSTDGRTAPSTVSSGDPRVLPEKMRDLADLRKKWDKNPQRKRDKEKWEGDEKVPIDYRALMADKSNGGIGYTGRSGAEIFNWRQAEHNRFADEAQNVELAYRPTCNYLSRVLRTLMQNADRKGYRDGERSGLLDKRRAYQMGAARFDVFRQPPNPRDNRPIVLLTTDCSGSMDGGYGLNRETRAFHAMAATLVLAGSLHRLGIPFESHAFDSLIYITKLFEDRYDQSVVRAMSNTWAHPGLATYAAEALAIGWARIMYRSEPRKVLIMVTDGQVAQNTTHLVRAIEKQGTLVIGVGIGVDVRKTFPHAVQIDNAADLPNRFARLMKQFLPADGKWRAAA